MGKGSSKTMGKTRAIRCCCYQRKTEGHQGFFKPNGDWRFVLDFQGLNQATVNVERWPIPNINELLRRIGDKKPRYFGIMDLTSGFFQAAISAESSAFTAFVTKNKVYQWTRVPMGITAAPSYFQRVISTQVLGGLVGHICEVYIDDIIVWGDSEESFLRNLETVLTRFKEHGITVNPEKCKLGLEAIEYVGHVINRDGIHFTREKLDSVVNFPLPTTKRDLKAFICLVNYFRDHLKDASVIMRPLDALVCKYHPKELVDWNEEAIDAYEEIKKVVDECPMLHFLDNTSEIVIQTDACNTGMGAYLFQVREGKEVPIAFMSKAFDKILGKWCTFQQEGFVIYYAIKKWRHLLLDKKFTLMTDHANLMYLKGYSDPKVLRWMLALQEYDFEVKHIKGSDNKVADAFSRLCVVNQREECVNPKKGKPDWSSYVVGARQSSRLRARREMRDPEVMVPETPSVSRGTTNKDNYTGRSKNVDRSKKGLGVSWADEANVAESSCDNEAHPDSRAKVIVFVDSPSHHPPTVDRGSDPAPGQERMEVVKSSVSGSQDRGISGLPNLSTPDGPRVESVLIVSDTLKEPLGEPISLCEQSQDSPDQRGMNQDDTTPQVLLKDRDIERDKKVNDWFLKVHNHESGHTGLERTMNKLFELSEVRRLSLRNSLPKGLTLKIAKLLKSCNTCQKNAVAKRTSQASHFSCSSYQKMKRIAIDYIECLRPDIDENDMIVVVIDCFSRFVCLYPVRSKGTEVFLSSYLKWLGLGMGEPSEILTDRGSQFTSRLTLELARRVGHTMIYTTANSKQENAIVERANRETMRHLRNIVMDKRAIDEWSREVPLVQRIMNSMVHSSTGVRSSSVVYSSEIDQSIFRNTETIIDTEDMEKLKEVQSGEEESPDIIEWERDWLLRLENSQKFYIERAIKSLTEMDERHRAQMPTNVSSFEIGDLVLVEQGSAFRRGPESKLLPLLAGPFEVTQRVGDIYTLKNAITNKLRDVHLANLHGYVSDEYSMTPAAAAITDYAGLFLVDHVVKEHPKNKISHNVKLRDLQFLVRWVGYSQESDSWQKWSTLRKHPRFRVFLETHRLKSYNNLAKKLPTLLEGDVDDDEEIA